MNNIPKEQWEELLRISRGKERRESECEHEGKLSAIDGCEFCGDRILIVPFHVYKALMSGEDFKTIKKLVEEK